MKDDHKDKGKGHSDSFLDKSIIFLCPRDVYVNVGLCPFHFLPEVEVVVGSVCIYREPL